MWLLRDLEAEVSVFTTGIVEHLDFNGPLCRCRQGQKDLCKAVDPSCLSVYVDLMVPTDIHCGILYVNLYQYVIDDPCFKIDKALTSS